MARADSAGWRPEAGAESSKSTLCPGSLARGGQRVVGQKVTHNQSLLVYFSETTLSSDVNEVLNNGNKILFNSKFNRQLHSLQSPNVIEVAHIKDGRHPWAPDNLCPCYHYSIPRCALQVLDLCGLQCEEGGVGDPMGGWSLTVALSTMVVQARAAAQKALGREGERERKRVLAMERERDVVKRERGGGLEEGEGGGLLVESVRKEKEETSGCQREDQQVKGVRRRMEMERRKESAAVAGGKGEADSEVDSEVVVCVRADLFVNARSWERVRAALGTTGPLKLQCRYVRVEELSVSSIGSLLDLLPRHVLLGVDIRYSCLGVAGLALLLPQLSMFPMLSSLRLHYCNLDIRRDMAGQEGAMKDMSQGLGKLSQLRRLSLTALRLPGHLRMLLR